MGVSALFRVTDGRDGARFMVIVAPRASKTALAGIHDGALKIRLAAPPVDGAANEELAGFLSRLFGAPKSSFSIVTGQTSKRKTVEARGLKPAEAEKMIELALAEIDGKRGK
jgi:hypothetical protein